MNTREIVSEIIDGFEQNDAEKIIKNITDDIRWVMIGNETISGKNEMITWFKNNPDKQMLSATKEHFLVDGNIAMVNGEVKCTDKSDKIYDLFYCDIYEVRGDKVCKLSSYISEKR